MTVDQVQILLGLPGRPQAVTARAAIEAACDQFAVTDQPPQFWAAMEEISIVRQSETDSEWDELQRSPAKQYRYRVAKWAAGVRPTGDSARVRTEWASLILGAT